MVLGRRGGERRLARGRAGRHGPARPERRRQDDAAACDRRADATVAGNGLGVRRAGAAEPRRLPADRLHAGARVGLRLPDGTSSSSSSPRGSRRSRTWTAPSRRAIETVDLVEHQDRRLGGYSRGMRQRMRLAATLVHDPPLLVLDEPLSGTDPAQRLHLRDVIRGLAAEGRTILVSSHILEEVDELADRIHLMVSGKLAASGDYRAIRQKLERPAVPRPRRLRRPAGARRRAAGRRGRRVGRDRRRRPACACHEPRRRVAPARRFRPSRAARRSADPRRAARRLARERLRVPRDRERKVTAIFGLTLRQLAGSRRLWLVLGLVALPVLAAVALPRRGVDDHERRGSRTTSRGRSSARRSSPS